MASTRWRCWIPEAGQPDGYGSTATVMREILVITAPTADPGTIGGRREWCVNTCTVVDPVTRAAYVNEDGRAYRWDFTTNALAGGHEQWRGPGYTATAMGPDGAIYAVNNAQLHSIGA